MPKVSQIIATCAVNKYAEFCANIRYGTDFMTRSMWKSQFELFIKKIFDVQGVLVTGCYFRVKYFEKS